MLQDPFVLLVLVGLALFSSLALIAMSIYWLARGPARRRSAAPPLAAPQQPAPAGDDLARVVARLDPNLRREFPSLAARLNDAPGYEPPKAPRHAYRTAAPAPILNPTAATYEVEVMAEAPRVIRERADPQLISAAPEPVPHRVRPDPQPIAAASSQPASAAAPDSGLETIAQLWPTLSARDRHELVELARLKARP
ncbi:MAG: hypothetical protein IT317_13570 [Anaerolineales bacterium]|nr:hypothetical protein [Anaerolineales bacterium]